MWYLQPCRQSWRQRQRHQPGREPVDMNISAGDGIGNVALNVIGNRNTLRAETGFLNFAINTGGPFSFPTAATTLSLRLAA